MIEFGPDFSNYGGFLASDTVQAWKRFEKPIRFAIAGTQAKRVTRQQLTALQDGGPIELNAYTPIYPSRSFGSMKEQMERGIEVVDGFPIRRLYADFETWPGEFGFWPMDTGRVVEMIHEAIDGAGSFPVGIYTGRPWWTVVAGNTKDFAALPLMHADYGPFARPYTFDNLPDLDAFVPYGGMKLHFWQFGNTQQFEGYSVDLNARKSEDQMISKNVIGEWWNKRSIGQTPDDQQFYFMNAQDDFDLKAIGNPSRIRLGIYKSDGFGYMRFFNADGSEAEPVGWGNHDAVFGTVDVAPAASGLVAFRVEDGDVTTAVVRLIGYWP